MNKMSSGSAQHTEPRNKREKGCPFVAAGWKTVDYKDVETLRRFLTEKGKILPRRVTGVSARFQRYLTTAIKHARYIGLLPFVAND